MLKGTFTLALAALAAVSAHAMPISTYTWYEFGFTTVGTPATGCLHNSCTVSTGTPTTAAGDPPYTFALAGPGTLSVQDAFLPGDAFAVYDFGLLLGTTPMVPGDVFHTCGSDPVACSGDPALSQGAFQLASGTHSISFAATESVVNSGAAYFQVVPNAAASVTPEPSTIVLLGSGVLGIAGTLRRRIVA